LVFVFEKLRNWFRVSIAHIRYYFYEAEDNQTDILKIADSDVAIRPSGMLYYQQRLVDSCVSEDATNFSEQPCLPRDIYLEDIERSEAEAAEASLPDFQQYLADSANMEVVEARPVSARQQAWAGFAGWLASSVKITGRGLASLLVAVASFLLMMVKDIAIAFKGLPGWPKEAVKHVQETVDFLPELSLRRRLAAWRLKRQSIVQPETEMEMSEPEMSFFVLGGPDFARRSFWRRFWDGLLAAGRVLFTWQILLNLAVLGFGLWLTVGALLGGDTVKLVIKLTQATILVVLVNMAIYYKPEKG
jgi:hypothetical protein